jgi:hypothetical protein
VVYGGSGANSNQGYVRVYKVRSLSFEVHFESYTTTSPFQNTAGTWNLYGNEIIGEKADSQAGCAVSMSAVGDRITVGAKGDNGYIGYSALYELAGSTWTKLKDVRGCCANMNLGFSVSLSPNGLVFATPFPNWNSNGGGMVVNEQPSTSDPWQQHNQVSGPANSYSGTDVAVTDSALVGTYC